MVMRETTPDEVEISIVPARSESVERRAAAAKHRLVAEDSVADLAAVVAVMEDRRQKLLDADSAASVNAAPTPPTPVVHSPLRWLLAPAFAMNMFCNHWCRDSFGALQVPLETHANLTSTQYNSISSAYFVPNVFMPIIAGVIASCEPRKNGGHTFLAVSLLAAVGNIIVFYGAYQLGKVDTSSLYVLFLSLIHI